MDTKTYANLPPRKALNERIASAIARFMIGGIASAYKTRADAARAETGPVLLQINFRHLDEHDAFRAKMDGYAPFLAEVPGLRWKVWADDRASGRATGAYLFGSRAEARFYLDELFAKSMSEDPTIADIEIVMLDVLPHASRITRAPID